MATITITIPDTLVPRLTTAMRATFPKYSGLTDAACFKQVTGDYWRGVLATYEGQVAFQDAEQHSIAAYNQAETDGSGIG